MQSVVSVVTSLAGLFHDIGKATSGFQKRLQANCNSGAKPIFGADPIKHEYMSVLILEAWMQDQFGGFMKMDDERWLRVMADPEAFKRSLNKVFTKSRLVDEEFLSTLHAAPGAQSIRSLRLVSDTRHPDFVNSAIRYALMFLVVSHHKMPTNDFIRKKEIYPLLSEPYIDRSAKWGKGLWSAIPKGSKQLWDDSEAPWMQQVADIAGNILALLPALRERLGGHSVHGEAFLTAISHVGRTSLVWADFEVSSRKGDEPDNGWLDSAVGWANTVGDQRPGQRLDDHLIRVGQLAPDYVSKMSGAGVCLRREISALARMDLGEKFRWQIEAEQLLCDAPRDQGLLVMLMAGTGTGKTIGAARLMKAVSPDGMRFNVALGLRTLTLQTMDSYKQSLGLNDQEAALLMGCDVEKAIHAAKVDHAVDGASHGLDHVTEHMVVGSKTFSKLWEKLDVLESCPVVVSTIDSIIDSAISSRNTGVLTAARIASSDLIIDEIDSYSENDLVSVAKLVYLTGFFGRVPIISSATTTPEIAEMIFHAYRSGYSAGAAYRGAEDVVNVAWVSEEYAANQLCRDVLATSFQESHNKFAVNMTELLFKRRKKRKGDLLHLNDITKLETAFGIMERACVLLHRKNHEIDPQTGKRFSFGLVRLSTVESCKEFALYLKENSRLHGIELKICCYHSQQMVGYQHCYEALYNSILSRKPTSDGDPAIFDHAVARAILDNTDHPDVMLVMVSSPIEEVGRDHDFDWGIVEPTSLRAIIQTIGRILRHRDIYVDQTNVLLLSTTLRAIKFPFAKQFFAYPGPETPNKIDNTIFENFTKSTRAMIDLTCVRDGMDARECLLPLDMIKSKLAQREREVQRLHFWPSKNASGNKNASSYFDQPVLRFGCSHNEEFPFRGNNESVSYAQLGERRWTLEVNGKLMHGNYSENLTELNNDSSIWLYVPTAGEVDKRYRAVFGSLTNDEYRSMMYVFSVNKYENEGVPKVGYSIQSGAFKINER
ncbi:MAG: hypothetical protein RSD49_04840 [Hafnia sp.]